MSDGLGKKSLTATWGSVEKDTLGWAHTEFVELIGMLNRIQNHFLEVLLDIFKTTDIIPRNIGNLDNCLS
jgi:hypothetical protein